MRKNRRNLGRDHTTGTSGVRVALTTPATVPNAWFSTGLDKNHRALKAWFWVAADTLRSTATHVRHTLTSAEESAAGAWLRVHVCQCRTHWVEAFKVVGASCRTWMALANLV